MPTEEVSGSNNYQIRRLGKFEITYQGLIKKHYRRDARAKEQFEQLVEDLVKEAESNPCLDCVSDPEPFPAGTAQQGFEFRKKRWRRLPGLQGAARFGRLLFVVHHPKKIVFLVWIYTHAEYQEPKSRPPDKELKIEVNFVKQEIFNELENET
jgi:hypothetical protein